MHLANEKLQDQQQNTKGLTMLTDGEKFDKYLEQAGIYLPYDN